MYKEKLPHAQTALILGISSIITACCCYGLIGVIIGIIGLSQSKKAIRIYESDPNSFDGINNAETGRTTSIIGIVIGVISVIWYYYMWSSGEYEIIMEEYQHLLDEQ